jgi:outer membrane protein TolC
MALPAGWKEAPACRLAARGRPIDCRWRGEWWKLFGDSQLDALADQVQVSNQNIAAAVANYAQARRWCACSVRRCSRRSV